MSASSRARRVNIPLRVGATALLLLTLVGGGCRRAPAVDPAALVAEATAFVEAGNGVEALAILARIPPDADVDVRQLRAEAAIVAGNWEAAAAAVAALPENDTRAVLQRDLCAQHALALLDDDATNQVVAAALAPCGDDPRIDLVVLREVAALRDTTPTALDVDRLTGVVASLPAQPEGPELDAAATRLESLCLSLAEAHADPLLHVQLLALAWRVGQDEALATRLRDTALARGEVVAQTDPHTAVSILEHLYMSRVPGLTVPDDMRARAEEIAREALFPTYAHNIRTRYDRRTMPANRAAGLHPAEGDDLLIRGTDAAAREAAVVAWIYPAAERPAPDVPPNFLALAGLCTDDTSPCVLSSDVWTRLMYDIEVYEGRTREAASP